MIRTKYNPLCPTRWEKILGCNLPGLTSLSSRDMVVNDFMHVKSYTICERYQLIVTMITGNLEKSYIMMRDIINKCDIKIADNYYSPRQPLTLYLNRIDGKIAVGGISLLSNTAKYSN